MTTFVRPQPPFARLVGAVLATVALVAALVAMASPASAHARLEGSSPQDGATLAAVPPEITLKFNEPIEQGLNQVSVTSGDTDVAQGDPQVEGKNVYQAIDFGMKPGDYTVTYKVVSADGHPVSGSFSFTYAPPEADSGAGKDPKATPFSPTSSPTPSEEPSEASTSRSQEPSDSASSTTTEETPQDSPSVDEKGEADEAGTEGSSPWWWAAAVAALVVVTGGLALLVRGRRDPEDEDIR